jgi:uroporphyrinogen-III synthase
MRGIQGFFKLVDLAGLKPTDIKNPKFSCIGKATNSELKKFGFNSSYINPDSTSKEFSARLIQSVIEESNKVLLPLGERADTFLTESLQKVCQARRINVYKTIDVEQIDYNILSIIKKDEYGILVFTSPSAFDNFIKLSKFTPESNNLKIATIGKKTSEVVKRAKFNVMVEAKNSTIEGLAVEIKREFLV